MKALTVSQPFASLIASGEKWVENRRWWVQYRGPLAIHAGKGTQYLDREELADYPTGCVVAVCRLVTCVRLIQFSYNNPDRRVLRELAEAGIGVSDFLDHRHTEGPYCWVLSEVRALPEPVPCRGSKGLWDWEE